MGYSSSRKYQYLAGFCVNIISISYGAFCGWPSASFLELQADTSPLETGRMSDEAAGWVASNICLGGIVGTVLFAWLADKVGRKRCLLWMSVPGMLGWLIIPFARTPMHLCVARFLGGTTGGGCFAVIPIYIVELAENSVRGVLGTILLLAANTGVLLAFVLGYYFSYATVAWIMSVLPVIFVACFAFMPETPMHLALHNKLDQAEYSLRYYRNVRSRASKELSDELQLELIKLRQSPKDSSWNYEDVASGEAAAGVTFTDFAAPKARKAFLIGLGLVCANQLCGCFAMLNYTAVIFQQSGSSLPPTVAAIIVGVIQLVGTYMSTLLVERAGRKFLLLISAVGIGLGQCMMGGYSWASAMGYDTSSYSWLPIAGFSFMLFIAAWGLLTLPFLVISEIMPPKIRSMANMLLMAWLWLLAACSIKMLPVLTETFGVHGTVFMFAACSFASALFIAIFIPETKGKTIEAILEKL